MVEVVIPDHEYKIVVQSISFDSNAAGFSKLSKEQSLSNNQTLDEVAEELKGLTDADINIIIEGHANNISGTQKEQVEELLPLSQKRAEKIVEELVKRGVDPKILTPVGVGGSEPIAGKNDRANWWKNRRVEFIIKQ
ncbi:MAG: OmpA family protein [Treponema sp.]|nr:OmpA family protein [Treponema sp.]